MMNRRSFIGSGTVLGTSILLEHSWARLLAQDLRGSVPSAPIKTTSGPIRGVVVDTVHAFYGVPYGATTADAGRFMPPRKPQPWSSVRECIAYGPRCPQGPSSLIPEMAAVDRHEPAGEDCLRLNVWTPAIGSGHRPVMVWLHGGGFARASGSAITYHGHNLARRRDVVVVTLNHRINGFGYLYLADVGGEKYANSGNAGMLDIVQALEWVRDNIAAFGGDPGNVTVFGQSGGGAKLTTLMGMPAAKGLFHKAIVQSGANITGMSKASATRATNALLARLGVKPDRIDDLQKIPAEQFVAAMMGAGTRAARGSDAADVGSGALPFEPVVDGRALPVAPFDPVATPLAANVPILCGTTEFEATWSRGTPLDDFDDATLRKNVKQLVRSDDAATDRLIAAYRKGRPGVSNVDLYLILASDYTFREGTLTVGDRRAEAKQAPVYMYCFTWRSPVRDGKLRSIHTLEVPFIFENVDLTTSMNGADADRYPLQERMSAAWTNFARTGNPNAPGLIPNWPAFDVSNRATMFIDNQWKVVNNPHADERRELNDVRRTVAGGGS
jgi:para-nitrobenzyl esterase